MTVVIFDIDTSDTFDHRYIENGIVEVVEVSEENGKLVHGMQVTKLGWDYNMCLIMAHKIDNRIFGKCDIQQYIMPKETLRGCIEEVGKNGMRITEKGKQWFKDYVLSHPFNESVFGMARMYKGD